jgi:hypothetical protein
MPKVKERSDDSLPPLPPEEVETFALHKAKDRSASGYPLRLPK